MARARNLKPSLFKNEVLGTSDPMLTLLFAGLWTLADRNGVLEDRPMRIKAELFPYRDITDLNGYLTELHRLKFLVRYEIDGTALIQITNFGKHQHPHPTEKASGLPMFTGSGEKSVKTPLENVFKTPSYLLPLTSKENTQEGACAESQISDKELAHTDEVLNGLRDRLGVIVLPAEREWGEACGTAYINGFTAAEVLKCYDTLKSQPWRKGRIAPQTVTANLPEIIKRGASTAEPKRKTAREYQAEADAIMELDRVAA